MKCHILGNVEFLKDIENNLPCKGLYYKQGNNGLFRLIYHGIYAKEVLKYMYSHSKLSLQRKYERYLKSLEWSNMRGLYKNNKLYIINKEMS